MLLLAIPTGNPSSLISLISQERLCGILVGDIKSRVHGSENLTVIMHQHELLTYGLKFGIIPSLPVKVPIMFTSPKYDAKIFAFLGTPVAERKRLDNSQFRHLQIHYRTTYSIASLQVPELVNMAPIVTIYKRCCVDTLIYHSALNRKKNASRLNNLACLSQGIDRNARNNTRPIIIVNKEFYMYVEFYCVHEFRDESHMLVYGGYRNTLVHDGLVEDLGPIHYGFTDICALSHLCAKVQGHGKKTFFVDELEVMEQRLRTALGRRI
jgi:hypothetical protein